MAIQEGIAYWLGVTTPNTKFEPVYTVDLVVSEDVANDFEAKGYKVKEISNGDEVIGKAITFKRKVNWPNGMVRQAPKLLDVNKNPIDELVGNGSVLKSNTASGKHLTSTETLKVWISKLCKLLT